MRRNQAQRRRIGRSSGKGTPAYRERRKVSAGRRSRRSLLFYVLVGSVCAQVAAAYAGMVALLALSTLLGLLLSAVTIRAEG